MTDANVPVRRWTFGPAYPSNVQHSERGGRVSEEWRLAAHEGKETASVGSEKVIAEAEEWQPRSCSTQAMSRGTRILEARSTIVGLGALLLKGAILLPSLWGIVSVARYNRGG
eukprot:825324-Rhodomonas_salina.1